MKKGKNIFDLSDLIFNLRFKAWYWTLAYMLDIKQVEDRKYLNLALSETKTNC